jgi:hypothetical protein
MMQGELRVIEWAQTEGEQGIRYLHRLEQFLDGHWVPVPLFRLRADNSLEPWPLPKPDMDRII